VGTSGAEQRVHFPVEAEAPESKRHLQLRTLLFQFLELAFAAPSSVVVSTLTLAARVLNWGRVAVTTNAPELRGIRASPHLRMAEESNVLNRSDESVIVTLDEMGGECLCGLGDVSWGAVGARFQLPER
jgi:hypothetical protein